MRIFHFGTVHPVEGGSIGEYALHLQCPWRIEDARGIVTGREDIWESSEVGEVYPTRNYEHANSVQEVALAAILKGYDPATKSLINETEFLGVERIKVNSFGDVTVYLSGGYRLVLFLNSTTGESWRFFRPGSNDPHLVMKFN